MRLDSAKKFAEAVGCLAVMTWMIMPRNNSAKLIEIMGESHKMMFKAAISRDGSATFEDLRTEAEVFESNAVELITDFWNGFVE